jgi:serine protease inhibitor
MSARRFARLTVLLVMIAVVAAVATGCSVTSDRLVRSGPPKADAAGMTDAETAVAAVNDFGFDLLRAEPASDSQNTVLSPFSVHAALSMTLNGAEGETAEQMRKVLHLEAASRRQVNESWASLLGDVRSRSSEQELATANSLWTESDVAFKRRFLDADRMYFGAEVRSLDFATKDVAKAINDWVSDNTEGKITKIVDQVPDLAVLYLVNAIYFRGTWDEEFDANDSGPGDFKLGDSDVVTVERMNRSELMPYAQTDELQATRLPYRGGDSAFYVLLPTKDRTVADVEEGLSAESFAELRARLLASENATQVVFAMPKLGTATATELSGALSELGMPRAFDPLKAQFGPMATVLPDRNVFVSRVLHKTALDVTEKGTEAAAATVVEMSAGASAGESDPVVMRVDRPYLVAIVDEPTGVILFLAEINDPRK